MKKLSILMAVCLLSWVAQAVLVDDFSDTSLAEYTNTRIFDQGTNDGIVFSSPSGGLQATQSNYDGVEMHLLLRDDYSLAVGEILMADVVNYSGNQDLGVAIAASASPTGIPDGSSGDQRSDLLLSACRGSQQTINTGFDGSTYLGTNQGWPGADVLTLYIERTSATTFDLGYDAGSGLVNVYTATVSNTNIGNAIGFYTDMRADNTIGTMDNLRIVPEPATLALLGIGLAFIRKRK
jgi:hypothetical protein